MKAIYLRREPQQPVEWPPRLSVVPGSAIVMPGKPWFVPDDGVTAPASLRAVAAIAFRLCRLGKGIEPQFASRYFDAAAPCFILLPPEGAPEAYDGFMHARDSSMALGPWQPLEDEYRLTGAGADITLTAEEIGLPALISRLSRCISIMMGDILVPFNLPEMTVSAAPGTHLSIILNNAPPFAPRIK